MEQRIKNWIEFFFKRKKKIPLTEKIEEKGKPQNNKIEVKEVKIKKIEIK